MRIVAPRRGGVTEMGTFRKYYMDTILEFLVPLSRLLISVYVVNLGTLRAGGGDIKIK